MPSSYPCNVVVGVPHGNNNYDCFFVNYPSFHSSRIPDLGRYFLQHVANRFCTEYTKPVSATPPCITPACAADSPLGLQVGIGPTYCSELVLLQQKWIEADNSGERDAFMTYLGQLTGHYCPDAAATETSRYDGHEINESDVFPCHPFSYRPSLTGVWFCNC